MEDFNALWTFIAGRLDLSDDEAKAMAKRLGFHGIFTWEQWVDQDEPIA
jgi:ribulose-5-phosphate 4-epimerase/fuculose-1-phosphate aldolase